MKIVKEFLNNDIYFIEVVADKIVINDNYGGIIILDDQLNIIKHLPLIDDLVIDISFIRDNQIVLGCYENQCLILVDVKSFAFKLIKLNNKYKDVSFIPFYEWVNNDLLLISENGLVETSVNLLNGTVNDVYNEARSECEPSLVYNWKKLSKYTLHKAYSNQYLAIIEQNNSISLIDYKDDTMYKLNLKSINFHDIELNKNCVAQISEEQIVVSVGEKSITIYPETDECRFLRAKFITNDNVTNLFLLMCSNSDSSCCTIAKYNITDRGTVNVFPCQE